MLTTIVSFVVVLGVLIIIHELGHFWVARLSGVGVERFSIGFGPVLWRVRTKATEYCISAIPMGGYVKMMGDDENPLESGGTGAVDPRRAFNTKPIWVRFLIVFAGPGMNFVLAAVIFALVFMTLGRPVLTAVIGRAVESGPAAAAGLQPGDRIVAVAGQPVRHWDEVVRAVQAIEGPPAEGRTAQPVELQVVRAGAERRVTLTPVLGKERDILGESHAVWDLGARPLLPAVVGDAVPGEPAARAGMRGGDTVIEVQGRPVLSWEDMAEAIRKRGGQPTEIVVRRGEATERLIVTPNKVKDRAPDGSEIEVGRVGISPGGAGEFERSGPLRAVRDGVVRTGEVTALTALAFYKIVVGQLDRSNIGGPIQIARAAGDQARQGPASLAFFAAVISVNLAVLNLLPVPMLDGGHLLFFVIEGILGRPLSVRKREVAQQVGFVLLMLLMVYAVYNDLSRFFR